MQCQSSHPRTRKLKPLRVGHNNDKQQQLNSSSAIKFIQITITLIYRSECTADTWNETRSQLPQSHDNSLVRIRTGSLAHFKWPRMLHWIVRVCFQHFCPYCDDRCQCLRLWLSRNKFDYLSSTDYSKHVNDSLSVINTALYWLIGEEWLIVSGWVGECVGVIVASWNRRTFREF